MKSHLPTIVLVVVAAMLAIPSLTQAQTNATWNVTISPAAGGTKTSVSFYATGDWITGWTATNTASPGGNAIGMSGFGTSPANAWTMANTNFFVPQFGTFSDVTQAISRPLTNVAFNNFGAGQVFLSLFYDTIDQTNGDTLMYAFDSTPTVLEFDLPFSNFNPGTYNTIDPFENRPGIAYNMEIVPEPSTYALLALSAAGLGGYVLRRRRR